MAFGRPLAVVLLLLSAAVPSHSQLDASWTPAGDGPLPLSDNYRSTLRKLCKLERQDNLPPKVRGFNAATVPTCAHLYSPVLHLCLLKMVRTAA